MTAVCPSVRPSVCAQLTSRHLRWCPALGLSCGLLAVCGTDRCGLQVMESGDECLCTAAAFYHVFTLHATITVCPLNHRVLC